MIYGVLLAGGPLASSAVMRNMLGHCTIQPYLAARTFTQWNDSFMPLIPSWFGPTDWTAIEGFYRGMEGVPWAVWWTPLLAWCSFLTAFVVASVCLILLFQRQWITYERLTFPLAQIPLAMVVEAGRKGGRGGARLTGSSLFWIGLLLSFGLTALETLSRYFPSIPAIPLGPVRVMPWQRVGPLAGLGEINVVLWPWLIGVAYLIPAELSFSCWFFWFVRLGLTVIAIAAGAEPRRPMGWWTSDFPAPVYQGAGALLGICGWCVWSARHHLRGAIRSALGGPPAPGEADEPLPHRWALIGLVLSCGWLVGFCWLAGAGVGFGIVVVVLILVYYVTWARLRAETGLGFLSYPFFPQQLIMAPFGNTIFMPRDLVMLYRTWFTSVPNGGGLEAVAGNVLESMKIADAARIRKRQLLRTMAIGFFIALVVGTYVTLTGIYHYGHERLLSAPWGESHLRNPSWELDYHLTNVRGIDPSACIALSAGAVVAVLLQMMRSRFWWWPFHPLGYLAASTWAMYMHYMPFMIGWLARLLVVRYGGLRLFGRTVPLAAGLIAGDLLNEVMWGVVTLVTGTPFRPGRHW